MTPGYDRLAKFYDRAFKPFERLWLSRMRAETLALLPGNATLLEIGVGTGANFKFYPQNKQAVATEISLKMFEFAGGKTDSIRLVQADAQCLPFPANLFDAAFATLVFCSIPCPKMAFGELIRTVKPNGRIILLDHVRPKGRLGSCFDLLNVFTVALINDHFNRETARSAKDAGLRVLEIRERAFGILNLIVCEVVK